MGLFSKIKEKLNNKTVFENKKQEEKFSKGLEKTRKEFSDKLNNLNKKYKKVNSEYFEELEEMLIMADIGVNTVINFMDRLVDRARKEKISDPETLKELIVDELFIIYVNEEILVDKIKYNENGPTVILFVGVNGVGKTTTIAKIAKKEKDNGKKVMLVAGDTFRAGAIQQLAIWADKVGVDVVSTNEGADPSSVMYTALEKAKEENSDPASVVYKGVDKAIKEKYDVVLVDTAGRLQNKLNLMKELEKI